MIATMRPMFKEAKQKCVQDQRGAKKTEKLKTNKMQTKQKQIMNTSCRLLQESEKKKIHTSLKLISMTEKSKTLYPFSHQFAWSELMSCLIFNRKNKKSN